MNLIQFFNSGSSSSGSLRAVEPVVYQKYLTIATGTGAGLQDLMPALAVGACAAYGGQIVNNGCYDLKITASYLEGDDCDNCTPDTLTTTPIEFYVPKNSVFPMPDGFYQQVQVQTVDSNRAPVSNTTDVKVSMHSSHVPNCSGCVQAVATVPCFSSFPADGSFFTQSSDAPSTTFLSTSATVTGLTGGATISLWAIDNSFNLKVNGTSISSFDDLSLIDVTEMGTPSPSQGYLKFADGTFLNDGAPWDYDTSNPDPLVKVNITSGGVVTVQGRKTSGVYENLVGATWATVPINVGCTASNVFEVLQWEASDPTGLAGKIATT